jgi:hypothetical protein
MNYVLIDIVTTVGWRACIAVCNDAVCSTDMRLFCCSSALRSRKLFCVYICLILHRRHRVVSERADTYLAKDGAGSNAKLAIVRGRVAPVYVNPPANSYKTISYQIVIDIKRYLQSVQCLG